MRKFQEANDSVTIEQEQADQVRRTTGATLAARALEEVLPAIGKGYAPQNHARVAERMVRDMDKPDLLALLAESERVIRWAAQEAEGRIDKQKVGGLLHHADKCRAALSAARGEGRGG